MRHFKINYNFNQKGGIELDYLYYRLFSILSYTDKNKYGSTIPLELVNNFVNKITDRKRKRLIFNDDEIKEIYDKFKNYYNFDIISNRENYHEKLERTLKLLKDLFEKTRELYSDKTQEEIVQIFYNKLNNIQKDLFKNDKSKISNFLEEDKLTKIMQKIYKLKNYESCDEECIDQYYNFITKLLKIDENSSILLFNEILLDDKIKKKIFKTDKKIKSDIVARHNYLDLIKNYLKWVNRKDLLNYKNDLSKKIQNLIKNYKETLLNNNINLNLSEDKDSVTFVYENKLDESRQNQPGMRRIYYYRTTQLSDQEISDKINIILNKYNSKILLFEQINNEIIFKSINPESYKKFKDDLKKLFNKYDNIIDMDVRPSFHNYVDCIINDEEKLKDYYTALNDYNKKYNKKLVEYKNRKKNHYNNILNIFEKIYPNPQYQQDVEEYNKLLESLLNNIKFKSTLINLEIVDELKNTYRCTFNRDDLYYYDDNGNKRKSNNVTLFLGNNTNLGNINQSLDSLRQIENKNELARYKKIILDSIIYEDEYKYLEEDYTLYNIKKEDYSQSFKTSFIENKTKLNEISDVKNSGDTFENMVLMPSFLYIMDKMSNIRNLDVTKLRIYNGVYYESKDLEDSYKGELDLLILDEKNKIVAFGEIKSFYDGIMKAYKQMNRFNNFLKDIKNDFNTHSKFYTRNIIDKKEKNLQINGINENLNLDQVVEKNKNIFIILKEENIFNHIGSFDLVKRILSQIMRLNVINFHPIDKLVVNKENLRQQINTIAFSSINSIKNPCKKNSIFDNIYWDKENFKLILNTKDILEKYIAEDNLDNILVFKKDITIYDILGSTGLSETKRLQSLRNNLKNFDKIELKELNNKGNDLDYIQRKIDYLENRSERKVRERMEIERTELREIQKKEREDELLRRQAFKEAVNSPIKKKNEYIKNTKNVIIPKKNIKKQKLPVTRPKE